MSAYVQRTPVVVIFSFPNVELISSTSKQLIDNISTRRSVC